MTSAPWPVVIAGWLWWATVIGGILLLWRLDRWAQRHREDEQRRRLHAVEVTGTAADCSHVLPFPTGRHGGAA